MGWRFRKSFKVIPGLRLNLSKSGLSASIGGAPFTVNVGPRGLMGTTSLPGTGISYREHFGTGHEIPTPSPDSTFPHAVPQELPVPPTSSAPSAAPVTEIRSASTELMTSATLKDVKKLLQMTYEERTDIENQLERAKEAKSRAVDRFDSWNGGFLFKRIFNSAFAKRKEAAETETAKVVEFEEQLRLTAVSAQVDIEREQAEPYFKMRDAFARLCECAAIWDVKSKRAIDRFHERTVANEAIERQRVAFSLSKCDLIQWEEKIPHLGNANGGDIYLYPGFILYRTAREAFSVIDYHDIRAKASAVGFNEQESVPSDAKVIGQTWAKANKDGSRDKRFVNNLQIPIVQYASVEFKSTTGLWEEFYFSNPERVLNFLNALSAFVGSFAPQAALAAGNVN